MLLKILNLLVCISITDFKFCTGNSTLPMMPLLEHSYCKLLSEPIKVPNEVKPTALITSLNSDIDADVPLESEHVTKSRSKKTSKKLKMTTKPKKGSHVELLYKGRQLPRQPY